MGIYTYIHNMLCMLLRRHFQRALETQISTVLNLIANLNFSK